MRCRNECIKRYQLSCKRINKRRMSVNVSMTVTDLLARSLENACKEAVSQALTECGKMYNFDAEEAMRVLGLEKLLLQRKAMAKRVSKDKEKKEKVVKSKVCPLPFIASLVKEDVCQGLSFNHGLFTQCHGAKMECGAYCSKCQQQADKNSSGKPDSGCVSDRMSVDFKDSKGRKPSNYSKVIAKLGFSVEQAREVASACKVELDDSVFAVPEKKSKSEKSVEKSEGKRGRPKKASAAVEASNVTDLFAQLTTDADDMSELTTSSAGKAKLSAEEKAAKKAVLEAERAAKKSALEAERAAKKAALEEEKAAKKAETEAKRAAEKALAQQKREAKRVADKAERDAKRAAEKALAQQERDAKKVLAQQEKVSKPKKSPAVEAPPAIEATAAVEAPPAPKKVTVSIVTINGVQYYRNKATNTIMDKNTKQDIGTYDEKTNNIIPFPKDDELDVEESEEEYEDDDSEDDE